MIQCASESNKDLAAATDFTHCTCPISVLQAINGDDLRFDCSLEQQNCQLLWG
jgi:hypothetical protein